MLNRSKYYKVCLCIIVALCTLFTPISMANTEVQLVETIPLEKSKLTITPSLLADKTLLSSMKFDLRSNIEVQVKDQKTTQECWAFAANTALETNLLLTQNEQFDFSERHMVYATAKTFTDGTNPLGHNREANGGGNASIAMAYLTSGRGPVLETEMPFSVNEEKIALSEIEEKTVQKKVTDYMVFPTILKTKDTEGNITYTDEEKTTTYTEAQVEENRNNIKQHIMNYGAVTAMTVSGSAYSEYYNYNLDYPAFYCDNTNLILNHQISIIGWDDTYAVENFNEAHRPSNPGAYLVLNSYGTEGNYKYGCYYISYEDAYIEMGIVGIINVEDIDYDKIYQYDPLGVSSSLCLDEEKVLYGANVFSKDKSVVEQLNEISIASLVEQNFELYINSEDGELSQDKLQKVEIEETTIRQGYTTIKLKNPVKLTGEKFAVVVKYSGNNKKAYIGVESSTKTYWATATSNSGESYYSQDMNTWTDLTEVGLTNTNICIKAFTTEIESVITSDSYVIEEDLIYKISPNTKLEDFKNNLQGIEEAKILRNNIELQEGDIITTNTTLITSDNKTYTLVVTGDITESGSVTVTDVSKLKMHLVELELLDAIQQKAADVNYTTTITLTDLSQMKSAIVGLINL